MTNPYPCPECGGTGIVVCECCDSEQCCKHCLETGLDPAKIDVKRFRDDEMTLVAADGCTWVVWNGHVAIGRQSYREEFLLSLLALTDSRYTVHVERS